MARRGRQVAAPAVDAPERELDRGELVRRGERGGRLEFGDGRGVLAEARAQLADPRPKIGRIRVAERQRGLQVLDGFAVGEDGLGAIGRLAVRLGGLGGPAGRPLVANDQREPRDVVRPMPSRSSRRASATRRWSSRRRARLVVSSATSRNRPWLKS